MKAIRKINNGSVVYVRKSEKYDKLKYVLYGAFFGFICAYVLLHIFMG